MYGQVCNMNQHLLLVEPFRKIRAIIFFLAFSWNCCWSQSSDKKEALKFLLYTQFANNDIFSLINSIRGHKMQFVPMLWSMFFLMTFLLSQQSYKHLTLKASLVLTNFIFIKLNKTIYKKCIVIKQFSLNLLQISRFPLCQNGMPVSW